MLGSAAPSSLPIFVSLCPAGSAPVRPHDTAPQTKQGLADPASVLHA